MISVQELRLAIHGGVHGAAALQTIQKNSGRRGLRKLIAEAEDENDQSTLVHLALRAQFQLLNDARVPIHTLQERYGKHQETMTALAPAANLTRWCPLVDAVHYRLSSATRVLLAASSAATLRQCLTEADAYGQTVLHAAAGAKASGVARRVLRGGGDDVVKYALRQIDVRVPASLRVGDLHDAVGHADLELLLSVGRRRGELNSSWLDVRDRRGRTALHVACRAGRAGAAAALLAAGANHSEVEAEWGGSCGHTAAARGHTAVLDAWRAAGGDDEALDGFGRSVRGLLQQECWSAECWNAAGRPAAAAVEEPACDAREADGGWAPPPADVLETFGGAAASFARPPARSLTAVAAPLTREAFVRDHESLGRPLLLRNEPTVASWAARGWTRDSLAAAAGDATVVVSAKPYGLGDGAGSERTKLRDFLAGAAVGAANASAPPSFVFDEALLAGGGALAADASPDPPLFEIENGGAVLRQLSVGPPKAGAMPHFHGAAYNALQVGLRRWALVPPSAAVFSRVPALDHFRRLRFGGGGEEEAAEWVDVVQRPGDVLWVPELWGHATLSLAESVAVAVEYV